MSSGSDFDDLWHSLFLTDHRGGDSTDGRPKFWGPTEDCDMFYFQKKM